MGLTLCGGFRTEPEDGAPAGIATILMLGPVGPEMWRVFDDSPESVDGAPDPMDRWSRRVIGALAARFDAAALYPFGGPPHQPFLRWAARAEPLWPSRLGMMIHARRGLWVSWRGALGLREAIAPPPRPTGVSPCEPCPAPCLTACPVGAFSDAGYDVAACVGHLSRPEGAQCRETGCLARHACPAGSAYRPLPAQAAFHMAAFYSAQTRARQA